MKRLGLGAGSCMGKAITLGLLAVLAAAGHGIAKHKNEAGLAIRVRVQDYAQVSQKTLLGAERVSADIFEDAGIRVTWINCPAPECQEPFLPADLGLRLLPRSMAELALLNNETFGFAVVSADERPSFLASVFSDRVKTLADALGHSRAEILGYVMAHELGHLLLRSSEHSPFGIMRARLTREDLLRALRFTPAQAQLMAADLRLRTHEEATGGGLITTASH